MRLLGISAFLLVSAISILTIVLSVILSFTAALGDASNMHVIRELCGAAPIFPVAAGALLGWFWSFLMLPVRR